MNNNLKLTSLFIIVILSNQLFMGCTNSGPSCGEYDKTHVSSTNSISFSINASDNRIDNYSKAKVNILFQSEEFQQEYLYEFSNMELNQHYNIMNIRYNHSYDVVTHKYEHRFPMKRWVVFSLKMNIESEDPVISNHLFFNDTDTLTGKIRVEQIEESHKLRTNLTLDKNITGIEITSLSRKGDDPSRKQIILDIGGWNGQILKLFSKGAPCAD